MIRHAGGELASYRKPGGRSGGRWTCGYYGFEDGSPDGGQIAVDYSAGPVTPQVGNLYVLTCRNEAGALTVSRAVVYDPGDPFAGLFAAERAAELALERLDLPDPTVVLSPPGAQLVGLRTWFWLDDAWLSRDAAATIAGVTSTVTATPTQVVWDIGDGHTVTCTGPGARYDLSLAPHEQSSDCTHTFLWPSNRQPFGAYAVTATVTYVVEWAATTGAGGALGALTRSTTVPVVVEELQAVIR